VNKLEQFSSDLKYYLKHKKYVMAQYYCPHIRWLLVDGEGNNVSCRDCGNIANGVVAVRVRGWQFNFPQCKKHLRENPEVKAQSVPCFVPIKARL
jgi:hypothetical protein